MDLSALFPQSSTVDERINGAPISAQFSALPKADSIPDASFVDGGSAVLFQTPARAIGVIRLCCVTTNGLRRERIRLSTYLVSVTAGDGFTVRSQPLHGTDQAVDAILNRTYRAEELGMQDDATPQQLLDPLRTLAEHAFCPDGTTVLDGSLRTLARIIEPKPALITLSKSCSLLTSSGRPVGTALQAIAPGGTWQALVLDGTVQCRCLKLHPAAAHTFVLETRGDPDGSVLALLRAWSSDAAFPGYPYPLVLADQLARVTNQERETLRAMIAADAGPMLLAESRSAHDMLEHILYGKGMF